MVKLKLSLEQKVGELIRDARQEKGLTQGDLAVQSSTTRQSISQYENGHFLPQVHLLLRIAYVLDISLDRLKETYG